MKKRLAHCMKPQSGVALIMGLVMLLVVTLIAVAGMNSSTMHESMSANAQNMNKTFQAAESAVGAINGVLSGGNIAPLHAALAAGRGVPTGVTSFSVGDDDITSNYAVIHLGEVALKGGSSMDANESTPILKSYRFELQGSAEITAVNARTRVFKGIEYR